MAKKDSFIPGFPDPIQQQKVKPTYKTRKDWNKLVQEQLQFFRKFNRRDNTLGLIKRYDFDGALIKRRTDVLLDSLETVYDRYKSITGSQEHPNALGDEWIHLNLGFSNYTNIEIRGYILHAAAIWILDRISDDFDKKTAMYRLLPIDDDVWEDVNAPITWDTQHEDDLIASVQYVLHFRNSIDGSVERDGNESERVLTDNITAEGAHHRDTAYRKSFDGLMALIPQEDIECAIRHYEEYFWAWSDRYFACVRPLVQAYDRQNDRIQDLGKQFNKVRETLRQQIEDHERKMKAKKKTARQLRSGKPLPSDPMLSGTLPLPDLNAIGRTDSLFQRDYSASSPDLAFATDPAVNSILALSKEMDSLGDEYDDAIDMLHDILDKRNRFLMQIINQGCISKQDCLRVYGPEVAEHMNPIPVSDPFEMCFALLYLIDQGSDLPWLYGVGTGMMCEVTESLPWGIIEYDETEDEIVFGDAVASKPSTMPDWFERKYISKKKDISDFPRSLAQLVYESTGCIIPRDMHRFDSKLKELSRYGVRGKDALMLLSCMTILSHERRRTAALNFDEEYLRFIDDLDDTERDNLPEAKKEDEQTAILRAEIKRLKASLHDTEKLVRDTRKELAAAKEKASIEHRELADLREVVFNRESELQVTEDTTSIDFPYDVKRNTLVFGGHDSWEKAVKPLLTGNVRFISRDLIFDTSIIRHADVIWIQTNAISHKQYYRIVDTARQHSKPIRYFTYASASKCAEQVAENDD